jgi:simple sugar transport system permease protein
VILDENLLASAVILTTPILYAAVGELIAERSGIINIGLEGMMIVGAFFGFWAASESGSLWVGVLAGMGSGMALGAVMAALSVDARADQVIVGLGITILATGAAAFAYRRVFGSTQLVLLEPMAKLEIPWLHDIPGVGDALFNQRPLVYIAYLLVPAAWLLLYHTTWGLAIRAAGDLPEAAETAGVSVRRIRWLTTLTAGALCGLGGSFLSLDQTGTYLDGLTNGRGFLALSAVIFGAWRPFGVLGACFLFGGADALQLRVQGTSSVPTEVWMMFGALLLAYAIFHLLRRGTGTGVGRALRPEVIAGGLLAAGAASLALTRPAFGIPAQLWLALPYTLTLIALTGLRNREAVPRYLGIPFVRGAAD